MLHRPMQLHELAVGLCIAASTLRSDVRADEKFAGSQFDLESIVIVASDLEMLVNTSQELLPPLRAKLLIRGDLTQRHHSFMAGMWSNPELISDTSTTHVIILRDVAPATLRAAFDADEVVVVELDRPNLADPIVHTPFDPERRIPFNRDARRAHFVPEFEATFHDEQGQSIVAAIFDGGVVRSTHVEFADKRVGIQDSQEPETAHATHVAGTMAAKGVKPSAQGMAPALSVQSFYWKDDLQKLEALGDSVQVSNHSYGPSAGWTYRKKYGWIWWGDTTLSNVEDSAFGKYAADNEKLDDILFRNGHLLVVVAAGNDRSDAPATQPVSHSVRHRDPETNQLIWMRSTAQRNSDGFDNGGLDTIVGLGLSKNCLCVGAINDGGVVQATTFTNWGLADDGRIKPDIVANGQHLTSPTTPPIDTSLPDAIYTEMSGTSMATPVVAGISCVLAEFFEDRIGRKPTSAELKAILIHTATDSGVPGPDPIFGWGSINALRAGDVVAHETIQLKTVQAGDRVQFEMRGCQEPIRVTLVWTDPAGLTNTGGLDDPTPSLRNNLDLTLRSPDGKTFFPYRLVREDPLAEALQDGPNDVDNVEVVDAPSADGNWIIEVTATNLTIGNEQEFALVVSGLE